MACSRYQEFLDFAKKLALGGGALALAHFGDVRPEWKPDRSVVTRADLAVEKMIREAVLKRYPRHSILGEEGTREIRDLDGPVWVIDPVDGTSAFTRCLPIWGVSVACFEDRRPVAGAFFMPVLNDLYTATCDGPSFYGKEPIRIPEPGPADEESLLLVSSDFHKMAENRYPGKCRALGSTAANVCYVARGCATAEVTQGSYIWDVGAVGLILERAGGELRYLDGRPMDLGAVLEQTRTDGFYVASHPKAFDTVRETIRPYER